MSVFFGTDGIRGVVNDGLTFELAYKCGNALGGTLARPLILIGGDTRTTREFLTLAFSGGAINSGAEVIDIGICPTAGISFLTKELRADYGVVISASHNPSEFNGIKIFDENGMKLGDKKEEELERKFISTKIQTYDNLGTYKQDFSLVNLYIDYLVSCCDCSLSNLKIVLDGGNGASGKIAPKVFRKLGAKVVAINCRNDGKNINNNCGCLHIDSLTKAVKKYKADFGFAFDGDADRIIACDANGKIIDGDLIVFMLAKYFKSKKSLIKNMVVGTRHTNMGIEKALQKENIKLLRTDIGDKYVIAEIEKNELSLGGEQSGHVILREYMPTGDGILTAIKLAEMCKMTSKSLEELSQVELFPQCNINCKVKDKIKVINSELLSKEIEKQENILGKNSRIMVRFSGTEPVIRIMVEFQNYLSAEKSAKEIEKVIQTIDKSE